MNISFEKVYSFKTHIIILLVSLLFSFFIVGYMHETNSSLMEEYVEENCGNNSEKYEYLIANDPNNSWIAEFRNTKEYRLLYE